MIIAIKIALIVFLAVILIQDCKERAVHVLLFPISAALFMTLHYHIGNKMLFLTYIGINMLLVSLILLVLFLYSKLWLKIDFINGSFGLGDLFFFLIIATAYPTISFIVLFVGAIFFSLMAHYIYRKKQKAKTVPLAGYMALFFGMVIMISFVKGDALLYLW